MKNLFIFLFSLTAFSSLQAQIGIEGSTGLGKLKGIKKNNANFKPLSYDQKVGLFYRWSKAGFALKSGISYGTTTLEFADTEKIETKNLQIPAEFHFIASPKAKGSLYGVLGIGMDIPVSGDQKTQLEKVNVAGLLGAGYQIKVGRITLLPELGYHFGVTKYTKATFNTSAATYTSDEELVLNTFVIKLGIGF